VPDLPISPASVQRKSPAESVDCGAERQGESEERITLYHGRNRCVLTLPKPAARNGRRRRGRGKGSRHGKGRQKIDRHRRAYLDALNAKRREERRLAREAGQAAGTARRRGRKPKGNGAETHGNGDTVSAKALWEHARKLEPRQPWRAVVRELGVSDSAAQFAHRNQAMPPNVSPAAAARFLTL
jgi:hypothetical protein